MTQSSHQKQWRTQCSEWTSYKSWKKLAVNPLFSHNSMNNFPIIHYYLNTIICNKKLLFLVLYVFNHFPIDKPLCCFQILHINSAVINIIVHKLLFTPLPLFPLQIPSNTAIGSKATVNFCALTCYVLSNCPPERILLNCHQHRTRLYYQLSKSLSI